ncbi:MAG: PTS 2-O-a-mannosyl-D-glycerate transporter subunit IIABC [Thomasclavelia sp.]
MELSRLTNERLITLNSDYSSKEEVIKYLISKLYQEGKITDEQEFFKAVMAREKLTPTGIDAGLAIPHGKSEVVNEASFAVMTLNKPIKDWESVVETNQVQYVFLLAIPQTDQENKQMQLLAEMMTKMSNQEYTKKLYSSKTVSEFYQNLDADISEEKIKVFDKTIVAVTACAAGIAHTYMAAEALQKAGQELGVNVYVEKQGANGIEDRHTNEMLKEATAAIFAVDVAVKEETRFSHLPIVKTKVSTPLKSAKELILEALDKGEKTTRGEFVEQVRQDDTGFIATVKEAVLTGISHVIPLIVAGGMISAICVIGARLFGFTDLLNTEGSWLFLIKGMGSNLLGTLMVPVLAAYMAYSIGDKPALAAGFASGLCANTVGGGFLVGMLGGILAGYSIRYLKKWIPAKGTFAGFISFVVYPVLSCLSVGIILLLILGKPVAFINQTLVDFLGSLAGSNAAILGAVIGIMVSFDLGGPVNKAAYAFCVAAMAEGVLMPYCAFASVKMVSAFAVTFATKFKKDLFTPEEREVGNSTWLLGLAGITEGAIPFMMADPIRVILSLCTGSAICGAIVALFNIGLDVPGAGIFSIFVLTADNVPVAMFVWFFAAVLGAVISAALLIITRKNKLKKAD